jgi:hypothetical protein
MANKAFHLMQRVLIPTNTTPYLQQNISKPFLNYQLGTITQDMGYDNNGDQIFAVHIDTCDFITIVKAKLLQPATKWRALGEELR